MKKVLIVGGGISGVFASIRIKELHPDYEVSVFEHNDKLLKKIYATGNGKCNFANTGSLENKYNNNFALDIINDFNAEDIINYFKTMQIPARFVGELVYPYSESSETVANQLLKRIDELGIKVYLSTEVIDYSKDRLITNKGEYPYDILICSVGGKSSKLGSNGSFYNTLCSHGYELKETYPSLVAIKTKENTKMVEGLRAKAKVSLYKDNNLIHIEDGEVLFKKDGLSGIVIFNMSHFIAMEKDKNNISIHIDFAPNIEGEYESLVSPKLAKYLRNNNLDIHDTVFHFKNFYDYEYSQVTSGGLSLKEIDINLKSKKENNVYFIGEVLDIDAVCGGYNIMWALASANKVATKI